MVNIIYESWVLMVNNGCQPHFNEHMGAYPLANIHKNDGKSPWLNLSSKLLNYQILTQNISLLHSHYASLWEFNRFETNNDLHPSATLDVWRVQGPIKDQNQCPVGFLLRFPPKDRRCWEITDGIWSEAYTTLKLQRTIFWHDLHICNGPEENQREHRHKSIGKHGRLEDWAHCRSTSLRERDGTSILEEKVGHYALPNVPSRYQMIIFWNLPKR